MATLDGSVSLNTEPNQPGERGNRDLHAKSYLDAALRDPAEVGSGMVNGTANTNDVNGTADTSQGDLINGSMTDSEYGASVAQTLRENDDGNGTSMNGAGQGLEQERPGIERQESRHEYSAAGLDESPRILSRAKHIKSSSQKVDATDSTSLKSANTLVYENFKTQSNGVKLVTIKSPANYRKEQARTDREMVNVEGGSRTLVSGRQAGKGWERSGIRFAPMNVPLQRRLQTLVVLFHSTCIILGISAFFFLCAIPIFWPLLIIYMIYCMSSTAATSGTLWYRSEMLRSSSIWSLFASYFPARLHRSQELPPTRKYIFGYHPHGIISHGAFAAFATEALGFSQLFPGITNTLLTLDSNFRIPIYRDYALALGLASVSRESCENLLSKGGKNNEGMGRAITIVVGGAAESLGAQPYYMRLILKKRKGFIKMAIRTGADLVPVLAFGENDLYDQVTSTSHPGIHKFQLLVKKLLGFTIPLFHARGVFNYDVGLMPYRRPLNIVVGRPIKVVQSLQPQQDEIDRLHEEYLKELEGIWNSWKDEFAKDRKGELEFVE